MAERHYFLISPDNIMGNRFKLNGSEGHHLARVARLGVGDEIFLLDHEGNAHQATIKEVDSQTISGIVRTTIENYHESTITVHLGIGNLKGSKLGMVVEKATELGVKSITPLTMTYSVKRGINLDRLQKVAESAVKQCGRGVVPRVREPLSFEVWCKAIPPDSSALTVNADTSIPIRQWLESFGNRAKEIWLTVGPEGGYHRREIELARENGIARVSLGPRRLRSETAAISVIAVCDAFFSARRA